MDRRRHQGICFTAGIAKHQALISSAFIFIIARINPHRDISRLFMQIILKLKMRMMEFFLLIADIFYRRTHRWFNCRHYAGQIIFAGTHFTAQNHPVGGGKCLTGNTGFWFSRQKQIKHRVRNTVA